MAPRGHEGGGVAPFAAWRAWANACLPAQVGYNDVAAIATRKEMEEEGEEEGDGPRLDMRTEKELEAERARKREEREREQRAGPSAGERCVPGPLGSTPRAVRAALTAASFPSPPPVSFFGAAKSGGGSGKRTKRVLKSSTYIDDQGYIRARPTLQGPLLSLLLTPHPFAVLLAQGPRRSG